MSLASFDAPIAQGQAKELVLFVGTYTTGSKSEGIYICRMNLDSGALKIASVAKGVVNPSFLTIGPKQRYLYAVNEVMEYEGKQSGYVSAFSIDPKTLNLQPLNQQSSQGGAPCHLTIDKAGRFLLVANYMGGNVALLPIQRDGSLGPAADVVQHRGSGANPKRQEAPHAHSVTLNAANSLAFVADLGIDRLMIYRLDAKNGKLATHAQSSVQLKPGAGPRHFTFHPKGSYAYVINELDSTMTALTYNRADGTMNQLQTVSTLPDDFKGNNSCADVHVSPSGRFLYGSNRGHNSIVVYAIDEKSGKLTLTQHESTQGKTPRNFNIDPSGKFLLAANQDSDTIVSFRIDPQTGKLTPTGQTLEAPKPVCLQFAFPNG